MIRDFYMGFRYWLALKHNRPDEAGFWEEVMTGNFDGYFHRRRYGVS